MADHLAARAALQTPAISEGKSFRRFQISLFFGLRKLESHEKQQNMCQIKGSEIGPRQKYLSSPKVSRKCHVQMMMPVPSESEQLHQFRQKNDPLQPCEKNCHRSR
jgi:hypothetical protein